MSSASASASAARATWLPETTHHDAPPENDEPSVFAQGLAQMRAVDTYPVSRPLPLAITTGFLVGDQTDPAAELDRHLGVFIEDLKIELRYFGRSFDNLETRERELAELEAAGLSEPLQEAVHRALDSFRALHAVYERACGLRDRLGGMPPVTDAATAMGSIHAIRLVQAARLELSQAVKALGWQKILLSGAIDEWRWVHHESSRAVPASALSNRLADTVARLTCEMDVRSIIHFGNPQTTVEPSAAEGAEDAMTAFALRSVPRPLEMPPLFTPGQIGPLQDSLERHFAGGQLRVDRMWTDMHHHVSEEQFIRMLKHSGFLALAHAHLERINPGQGSIRSVVWPPIPDANDARDIIEGARHLGVVNMSLTIPRSFPPGRPYVLNLHPYGGNALSEIDRRQSPLEAPTDFDIWLEDDSVNLARIMPPSNDRPATYTIRVLPQIPPAALPA